MHRQPALYWSDSYRLNVALLFLIENYSATILSGSAFGELIIIKSLKVVFMNILFLATFGHFEQDEGMRFDPFLYRSGGNRT